MKKLYTKYLKEIIADNRSIHRNREMIDKNLVKHDDCGRKMYAVFRHSEPCVITSKGLSMDAVDMMIDCGFKPAIIIKEMHEIMINEMKTRYDYCHNVKLNKSEVARKYDIRRATIDDYIVKLSEAEAIIIEDDGSLSLSFKLSPFNLTDAVRWHEIKMLDYVAYGEVMDIVERQEWLYNRFTTAGGNIIMNDYGISFDWEHFIIDAYIYAASVV